MMQAIYRYWHDAKRILSSLFTKRLGQIQSFQNLTTLEGVITYLFQNNLFMTYMSYNCGDGQLQIHATFGGINARLSEMEEKMRETSKDNYYFGYVVTPYEALTGFLTKLRRTGVY